MVVPPGVPGQPLRHVVPGESGHSPGEGRSLGRLAWRRQRTDLRCGRFQHARMAQPKQIGLAQLDGSGTWSRRFASKTCRLRRVCWAPRRQIQGARRFQLLVNTQGRLTTEEEFGNIIVRAAKNWPDHAHPPDLGRVELGSSTYALRSLLDNKRLQLFQFHSGPVRTRSKPSQQVRDTMERLKKSFPEGVDYKIVYDPNGFRARIDSGGRTYLC